MKIKFLGAHNFESRDSHFVSLLIDDVLAVDAGALTSNLTFEEQKNLQTKNLPLLLYYLLTDRNLTLK